jgi:creatinine amidohydrolase
MKFWVAAGLVLVAATPGFSQPRSVFVEDMTGNEVEAAIAAGKTTAIFCVGANHADGPAISMIKHVALCREISRRVAEELGNALVLPVSPFTVAASQIDHTSAPSGTHVAGTMSLSGDVLALMTKDLVANTFAAGDFKNVMLMTDHSQGVDVLQRVAREMDRQWKPKGRHVYYIDMGNKGKDNAEQYFEKQGVNDDLKADPTHRSTRLDDNSTLAAVDPEHKWLRVDKIPQADLKYSTAEVGKILVDYKVKVAVEQIKQAQAGQLSATPSAR